MDMFNKFLTMEKLRQEWTYDKKGPNHALLFLAKLGLYDERNTKRLVIFGNWESSKKKAKYSTVLACLAEKKKKESKETKIESPRKTLFLVDLDNSVDIVLRISREFGTSPMHGFCGRSFKSEKIREQIPNLTMHRSLTSSKDAAEMAMSFHSTNLISSCILDVDSVSIVSRDAALEELRGQIKHAFPQLKVDVVSF